MADDNFQGFGNYATTEVDDLDTEVPQSGEGRGASASAVEEPEHVFKLAKLQSISSVPLHTKGLIQVVLANNVLVLACHNKNIVHIDLSDTSGGREPIIKDIIIPTPKGDDSQISKIFLDPTGNHLLISLESDENYYLHSSFNKPKPLPRCKGVRIESVAWDLQNTDARSTKEFLVGTNQGRIFEACIEAAKDLSKDMLWNKVYPLDISTSQAITGLRWERCQEDKARFFVIATTTSRIYQFIGGPTFETLFQHQEGPKFTEIPQGVRLVNADLAFFCKFRRANATNFAWLTGPGIYHGKISFVYQGSGDAVTTDTSLIRYPAKDPSAPPDPPLGIALTEFHYVLVYDQKIQCMNNLTEEVVFDLELSPKCGKIHCIAQDTFKENGRIFICASNLIYEMLIANEDRDVWRQKMEQKEWQSAIDYCKGDLEKQDIVWTAQAEHYFTLEQYELSALSFAKTTVPFEKVALKFINKEKRHFLLRYLNDKLATINPQHKMQITAICTWLTELYLHKLNQLADINSPSKAVTMEEFKAFLDKYKDSLNVETTFSLIAAHGRTEDMLHYAFLIEDYERLLSYFLQLNAFRQTIRVMLTLTQAHEALFYKFSPIIICHEPVDLVTCWINSKVQLKPKNLFPALMRYNPAKHPASTENQAIRYLEYSIRTNHDPAVHNYLLSLYAQQKDETALQKFLNDQPAFYDPKYALRLCTKLDKKRACVVIYSNMHMFEEAVDLALLEDLSLAKLHAGKPDDEILKKRLWLKIAQFVVKQCTKGDNKAANIKTVMLFLRECEKLLKIEDILPFFPEFTVIDDFKEEICRSLEEYNKHIAALKEEMAEATKSANLIRKDISALRNKCGVVAATQQCELCHCPALARQFFYFPCRHVMHAECLHDHMVGFLTPAQRQRAEELQSWLSYPPARSSVPGEQDDAAVAEYERAKQEYDDLIASECPFCGETIIAQTGEPFYSPDDADLIQKWSI